MGPSSSEVHQRLLHPMAAHLSWGFRTWNTVALVVWSHSGDFLLTQSSAIIVVWDPDTGGSLMEFDLGRMRSRLLSTFSETIAVARWMPNDQAVIFASSAEVHIVSLSGAIVWSHDFQNLSICDLIINDLDNALMLIVIGRVESPGSVGLNPSRSRVENRILVVDVKTKAVESLVPNFHTMTSITLAPSGRQVLVDYDEDDVPSELFDLHRNTLQLSRKYTFEGGPDQFKGPTAFGQIHTDAVQNHELAFGRSNGLHIWDHQSGKLLHTLPLLSQNWIPPSRLRDTVAWTSGGEIAIAIAVASEDGTIEVWTTSSPSRDPSTFNGSLPGSDESERTLVSRKHPLIGE
ncbi:hypothetical protein BS47DRAFT_627398 [Hydnum rufescens UP504]|uniref:Uncharacterized protein n=1 Tax=Hydnum rufescens UP504 TaxID=1448309 RepID=A0A9P6B5K6_9AGAM|nr:hypothetical protein BS47DRAFT_627398 [Hydnum rufescens UP504]